MSSGVQYARDNLFSSYITWVWILMEFRDTIIASLERFWALYVLIPIKKTYNWNLMIAQPQIVEPRSLHIVIREATVSYQS